MSEVWVIESEGTPITVECERDDLPDVMPHRNEQLERYVPERELGVFVGYLCEWQTWKTGLAHELGLESPDVVPDDSQMRVTLGDLARHGHRVKTTTDAVERMASIMVETNTDGYVRQSARLAEQLATITAVCAGTADAVTLDDPRWSPALVDVLLLRAELAQQRMLANELARVVTHTLKGAMLSAGGLIYLPSLIELCSAALDEPVTGADLLGRTEP